jgi:hypothetical protein
VTELPVSRAPPLPTEFGPRRCLTWCVERGPDPLAARRLHLELPAFGWAGR